MNTLKMIVKHGTMPSSTRLGGMRDNYISCYLCKFRIEAGQRVQFSRAYIEYASELVSHVECSAKTLKDSKSTLPYWWGR